MKDMFSYDGYLSRVLTNIMYVVSVNLLFLLCCIPVVTVGASAVAMHSVLLIFLRKDEVNIIPAFFKAFKDNFRKSTVLWLGMLIVALTLAVNYYILRDATGSVVYGIRILLNLILFLWVVLWIYLFPAMAYFENTLSGYVIFAVGIALSRLPWTAALLAIWAALLTIFFFMAQYSSFGAFLLICCGFSLPACISGKILLHLFNQYQEE